MLPSAYLQGAPTWSPDGGQVAFGDLLTGPAQPASEMRIHVVNLSIRQAATLPGSEGLWSARWSPDGRYMAAITSDSQTLMIFDFRQNRWEKVASAGQITNMDWISHTLPKIL